MYLDKCEESVKKKRKGFKEGEKKRMMISEETLTGIRRTGTFIHIRVLVCMTFVYVIFANCVFVPTGNNTCND